MDRTRRAHARGRARLPTRRAAAALATGLLLLGSAACARTGGTDYRPRLRHLTITMVPLLTREQTTTYPFLKDDFGPGGVLEGKEVYAFSPSTLAAYRGDTLVLDLVNPEDDRHTFALDGHPLIDISGETVVTDTVVARKAGIYRFVCDIPAHSPYMYGQLVVLSPP